MSDTCPARHFEDILPQIRQPARLIGGESGAGPGFAEHPDALRVVLGFPDTYEIGISNQAIQILYGLAGTMEGVAVERTYLPWVDAIAAMRREDVPLLTLETWSPVAGADLFGVTLQHEFNFTNLLEMLDLAGIPLVAAERGEGHPVVVAGGPACANFLPLSRFVDAVAVGDGEELFCEILEVMEGAKREGVSRAEGMRRLAQVEGVFVPGLSRTVGRRVLPRLHDAFYPEECLVPLTAGVHDRAWVEIMRGCTRGCRFCQAGMWYRPVRERSAAQTLRMAEAQLRSSGHQELALASLSTTDYSQLEQVLIRMAQDHPEVRVSLPSLRVDSAAVRLARLASPTGPSLTLAPEAGSLRMRAVINKNVTEADVLAAAEEAFRAGRTTLKLYFMIGLPWETDADVVAIADLCLTVRELGRSVLGPRAGRLQLNISVNNFIPKPFTPFQWAGMAERATLIRRQDLLRSRLRRPGVRLAMSGPDKSYLEAALARGGEDMGAVVLEAWTRGARFDSWTEQFRADAWKAAFETAGTSAEVLATSRLALDEPLPWEVISGVVERDFLLAEWAKAEREEATPDCRWEGCSDCGVCVEGLDNDLAPGKAAPAAPAAPVSSEATPRRRYVATFAVTGRGRFVGHLDRVEIFRRAVRKAGGRLGLSAGMRPKPLLSLALPLAVGVEGLREMAEFELAGDPGEAFGARLAAALPQHMRLIGLEACEEHRSLPARVTGASYEVQVHAGDGGSARDGRPARDDSSAGVDLVAVLRDAAACFEVCPEVVVEERREGQVRRLDVKKYVAGVQVHESAAPGATLTFRAAVTPRGTARPERVVEALAMLAGLELGAQSIVRTHVHLV